MRISFTPSKLYFVFDSVIAYNSDAVFLFSTLDDADDAPTDQSSVLPSNEETGTTERPTTGATAEQTGPLDQEVGSGEIEAEQILDDHSSETDGEGDGKDGEDDDDDDDDSGNGGENIDPYYHSTVPIILPRSRFAGHCNVETVKDGQFSSAASESGCTSPMIL